MTCKARPQFARRARVEGCRPRPRCGQLRRPALLPPTRGRSVHDLALGEFATAPRRNG